MNSRDISAMQRLLITSAGGTVGRLIIETISQAVAGDVDLLVADAAADLSYMSDLASGHKLPVSSDPDYERALSELLEEKDVDAILPLAEEECLIVSRMHRDGILKANYLGLSYEALKIVTNKPLCAQILSGDGLDVPAQKDIEDLQGLESGLRELGFPEKDIVFKPKSARGSRGFRILSATTDRLAEFSRKGGPVFIDLNQLKSVFEDSQHNLCDYFLSEFLPNGSASIDLVAWNGNVLGIYPHKRMGYEWGFVDHARIESGKEINEYCAAAVKSLNLHGMCNIELGFRSDGSPSLIEVNGRTSATLAQNKLVGVNCFEMFLNASKGKIEPVSQFTPAEYRTLTEYREIFSS